MNIEIRSQRLQLRLASQAAGSHASAIRQRFNTVVLARTEHVSRIVANWNRRNLETGGNFRRQIFQTVYRKVDPVLGQRLLNFLSEHSLSADLAESNIRNPVTSRLDVFNFDGVPLLFETRPDVIGLPER